jgi:hypothetical protein
MKLACRSFNLTNLLFRILETFVTQTVNLRAH